MPDYSSLCCPKCRGALDQGPSLRCRACGTDYPIQAGVPVMLPSVNGHGHQDGQDVPNEKAFYETMFSDLKGPSDGYCIVYGYEPVYRAVEKLDRGSILEPGCGTGHYSVNFTKMGFSVTGVDLSMNGLAAARQRASDAGQDTLFLCGDIKQLPFDDGHFDICFCSLVLHHFTSLEHVLKELSRVTRKHLVAFEVNAYDLISFTRFNVLNPLFGLENISKNQRALFPGTIRSLLEREGFTKFDLEFMDVHHYLGRTPNTPKAAALRAFKGAMKLFPSKFSRNKFLLHASR